jgi:hypothetical protein
MKKHVWLAAVAAAPLMLGGCEFFNNALAPSVSGAPIGADVHGTASVPTGQPTGTLVGTRVIEIRSDLNRLQQAVQQQTLKHQ